MPYRELFKNHMDEDALHEKRESFNHEVVFGILLRLSETVSV